MTDTKLIECADARAVATAGAQWLRAQIEGVLVDHDRCSLALSGGSTPKAMFSVLSQMPLEWPRIDIFQVDERIADDGDSARNLVAITNEFGDLGALIHEMDVTSNDLTKAAARYNEALPEQIDIIHLGLGPDGHTASLIPDDEVLGVVGTRIALTGVYQGHRRMTMTFDAINAAHWRLFEVVGADKAVALAQLRAHDTSIPASFVRRDGTTIIADASALTTRAEVTS